MINRLELLGHNAWVAEERLRLGGWILRADHGVTRRANSVLPIASQNIPIDMAINSVIDFYESRNLVPRFQITEVSHPQGLDSELIERGFTLGLQVEIWTAPLSSLIAKDTMLDTEISDSISNEWIETYNLGSDHDPATFNIRRAIMERTLQPKTYALSRVNDEVLAVGYGVVEDSWLGIFNIATRPEKRRLGAATSVNRHLGIWAQSLGATDAYLQVEVNNFPAKKLYKKLGFSHAYRYWYRDLVEKEDSAAGC